MATDALGERYEFGYTSAQWGYYILDRASAQELYDAGRQGVVKRLHGNAEWEPFDAETS